MIQKRKTDRVEIDNKHWSNNSLAPSLAKIEAWFSSCPYSDTSVSWTTEDKGYLLNLYIDINVKKSQLQNYRKYGNR